MTYALGPRAAAAAYRLIAYESVGSTSSEALDLARQGDPGRVWVVADMQTAGHGRRGRPWQTPRGNLAASLLLRNSDLGPVPATLGFVAGLALVSAVRAVAPDTSRADRLRLKWPNDVVCDRAKVAGILLEGIPFADMPGGIVVGIGVNVVEAPADLPYPATSLAECGVATDAETLFAALSDAWVECLALWDGGRGFPAVRERWLDCAAGIGSPIAVRMGDKEVSGIFETIDTEGRLIVRGGDGATHPVSAGDVHFGTAGSAGR